MTEKQVPSMRISVFTILAFTLLSLPLLAEPRVNQERHQEWHISPDETIRAKLLQRDEHSSLGLLQLASGTQVPAHRHAKSTETLYIQSGSGVFVIDGKKHLVEAGSIIRVPMNAEHSFQATSDVNAIQVYAPSGPEERFQKWDAQVLRP